MKVTVYFFAAHRDAVGRDDVILDLPPESDVHQAGLLAEDRWPALGRLLKHSRAAVNEEYVAWDHRLSEGDRVAFIPPVSGGSSAHDAASTGDRNNPETPHNVQPDS